jgi:hypothetical protein
MSALSQPDVVNEIVDISGNVDNLQDQDQDQDQEEPSADQDQDQEEPSADQDQEEPSADQDQDQDQEEPSADTADQDQEEPSADPADQEEEDKEPSADQDQDQEEPSADQDQDQDQEEPSADTADQDQDQENLIKYNEKVLFQLNELVQVVCRQTELTEEEARERLEKEKYNYMKVLNDYFGVKEIIRDSSSSTNQQIYGEIRKLMDTGARNFRNEQERTQYIQKVKDANNVKIE